MTRWHAAAATVGLALSACHAGTSANVEPRAATAENASVWEARATDPLARERGKVKAAPAPIDLARLRIDLAALPLASERLPASGEVVQVAQDLSEVSLVLATGLIAEIQIGPTRLYTQSAASPFEALVKPRPTRSFERLCREVGAAPIWWRGFRADTISEESLDFVEYFGTYDARRCQGVAATRRTAKAVALIPGALYAFRTCLENCESVPALPRRESVTIIGPPARLLLESRAELVDVTNAHVGTFSISEIQVSRDAIGTVSMNLPRQALERAGSLDQKKLLGAANVRLDVEVRGAALPQNGSLNVFLSAFQSGDGGDEPLALGLGPEELAQRFRRPGGP